MLRKLRKIFMCRPKDEVNKEHLLLLRQLAAAEKEIAAADNIFAQVKEACQIDQAIYFREAAICKYAYLLREVKTQNLRAVSVCLRRNYCRGR